mmetsp:Transcript_39861/g.71857  ORF Transcript_39861/g.71857 Transcript_39861/m.71857 type:complete len:272 (+) Transcript_39861:1075-1890(+)
MSIGYFKKNACVDRWCLLHQKWSGGGGRCAVIGCDRSEYTGRIRISTAGSIPLQHSRLHACHADAVSYVFECPDTNDSDTNCPSLRPSISSVPTPSPTTQTPTASPTYSYVPTSTPTLRPSLRPSISLVPASDPTITKPTASPTMLTVASPTSTNNQMIEQGSRTACLTQEECEKKSQEMNTESFNLGNYPTKGCFLQNTNVFFSLGTEEEMTMPELSGILVRVWCDDDGTLETPIPTWRPSLKPSISSAPPTSSVISISSTPTPDSTTKK